MAFNLPTNLSTVEAWVGALYGYSIGSATMTQVNADITNYGGLNNTLNAYYSAAFGSMTTASVAANIVANVGLGTDANAIAYVTGQLNAAAANARGVAVNNILNAFAGMTADKTYGAAATAWTATVAGAVTYEQSNSTDATIAAAAKSVAAAAAAPKSISLTNTSSIYTASGPNDIFVGTLGSGNGQFGTYNAATTISDGTGSTGSLFLSDLGSSLTLTFTPTAGNSLTGITALTLSTGEALTSDTTATSYSGVTSGTYSAVGAIGLTVPSTQSVTVYGSSQAAGNITVAGGKTVNITSTGVASTGSTNGLITVGGSTTTDPVGNVTINTSVASGNTAGPIAVNTNGGTTVSITDTLTGTGGAITVKDDQVSSTKTGTLNTVSIAGAVQSTVTSNALTSLTIANSTTGAAGFTVTNSFSTPTNTTLTLGLQNIAVGSAAAAAFTDTNNEISTLNINLTSYIPAGSTTASAINLYQVASGTYYGIADTGLRTVNISQTNSGTATLTTFLPTGVTSFGLTSGGFNDGTLLSNTLSVGGTGSLALTGVTSFAPTGSGALTVSVNAAKQSFNGAGHTGSEIVAIGQDATQSIVAGTGTSTAIVANLAASDLSSAYTNVSGFNKLGFGTSSSGTYDLSKWTKDTFSTIEFYGSTSATVTNAAANVNVNADLGASTVSVTSADSTGAADSSTLTIGLGGSSGTDASESVTSFSIADSVGVGYATLSIVANQKSTSTGSLRTDTVGTLTDTGLSTLNISGAANLTITNALADNASTLTINATGGGTAYTGSTSGNGIVTFTAGITDNMLNTLSVTGTEAVTIGTLTDSLGGTLTINDSSTKNVTISDSSNGSSHTLSFAVINASNTGTGSGVLILPTSTDGVIDTSLSQLNLTGQVSVGIGVSGTNTGVATGLTVSGATDNQTVKLYLTGAGSTKTDTITLGNGSDTIVIGTGAGTEKITLGSGANTVTGAPTGTQYVTVSSHAGNVDAYINSVVTTGGTASGSMPTATQPSTILAANSAILTGFTTGDTISFLADTAQGSAALSGTATISQKTSLAVTSGGISETHGTYSSGTFTYSSTGNDTLLTIDVGTSSDTYQHIVLVGYSGTLGTLATGVSTLG